MRFMQLQPLQGPELQHEGQGLLLVDDGEISRVERSVALLAVIAAAI